MTDSHVSISVHETCAGLIQDCYDNILSGAQSGADFFELMTIGLTYAALTRFFCIRISGNLKSH